MQTKMQGDAACAALAILTWLAVTMMRLVMIPERLFVLRSEIACSLCFVVGYLSSEDGLICSSLRLFSQRNALIRSALGLLGRCLTCLCESQSLISSSLCKFYAFYSSAATQ